MPELRTDEEAERFVEEADLTEYDLSGFKPVQFEFLPKDTKINMRIPTPLLESIKETAEKQGMSYQRYIRMTLEQSLQQTGLSHRS